MQEISDSLVIANLKIRQHLKHYGKGSARDGKCPWCGSDVAEYSQFIGGMGVGARVACLKCPYETEYYAGIDV